MVTLPVANLEANSTAIVKGATQFFLGHRRSRCPFLMEPCASSGLSFQCPPDPGRSFIPCGSKISAPAFMDLQADLPSPFSFRTPNSGFSGMRSPLLFPALVIAAPGAAGDDCCKPASRRIWRFRNRDAPRRPVFLCLSGRRRRRKPCFPLATFS